jgi:hypothetical protein
LKHNIEIKLTKLFHKLHSETAAGPSDTLMNDFLAFVTKDKTIMSKIMSSKPLNK